MPYSTDNPPDRISGLPKKAQEIWITAYNAASEEYKGDEEKANATAWSAVEKAGYEKDAEGKWHKKKSEAAAARYTTRGELVALAQGEAESQAVTIQVIRAGDFVDMHDKDLTVTAEDLDTFVRLSNALLAQEEVPIELGHPENPGAPAAAWYRRFFKQMVDGVEWVCAEIELSALGAQSLAEKLYKYFSAEIDPTEKVICGGGFVNRPAVSGQQTVGSLAFMRPRTHSDAPAAQPSGGAMPDARVNANPSAKPPSLLARVRDLIGRALNTAELEMSQEDLRDRIYKALRAKYSDPMDDWGSALPYIVQTYDDRIVVSKGDRYFQIPYTLNAQNDVELGEPVEGDVSLTFTPKPDGTTATAQLSAPPAPSSASAQDNSHQGGDQNMSGQATATPTAPVTAPAATPVTPATPAAPTTPVVPAPPAVNPLPVATVDPNLSEPEQLVLARQNATAAAQEHMRAFDAELARAREEAWQAAQAQMARKQRVASLATKLTTGRLQLPYTHQELNDILAKLSDDALAVVTPVLEKIQNAGLVDLSERGSSGPARGHRQLAEFAKPLLREWLAKDGNTIDGFFAANAAELGKASDYDLYEFEKK